MFDYDEWVRAAALVLDYYDLREMLAQCKERCILNPFEIKDYIQNSTHNLELVHALEELSSYELMEYLTDRYGVRWVETISYNMVLE